MSAKEAIELYKSRDVSEKLFRGDKSYLGNKNIRVYSEESARAKIFVEFVAMIVRCKMYIKLKEEILSAVVKSGRSYEEIMNFLNAGSDGEKTEK